VPGGILRASAQRAQRATGLAQLQGESRQGPHLQTGGAESRRRSFRFVLHLLAREQQTGVAGALIADLQLAHPPGRLERFLEAQLIDVQLDGRGRLG
jgi:hypothetical protein